MIVFSARPPRPLLSQTISVTRYLPGWSKVCFGWAVTSGMPSPKSHSRSTIAARRTRVALELSRLPGPDRLRHDGSRPPAADWASGLAAGSRSFLFPSTLQSVNSRAVYCGGPTTAACPLPVIAQRRKARAIDVPSAELHAVAAVVAEGAILEDQSPAGAVGAEAVAAVLGIPGLWSRRGPCSRRRSGRSSDGRCRRSRPGTGHPTGRSRGPCCSPSRRCS